MSKRKFTRIFSQIIKKFFQLQKLLLRAIHLFLHGFLVGNRRQGRQEGFILPTTALVLVVVSLVIAALILRSLSRTTQVIGEREQQVIYNAASPAIERAKAKLEYLFSSSGGLPAGIPPETTMVSKLLDDATYLNLYTLPGETRINLVAPSNPGTAASNAWTFTDPATGNQIAYSILINTQDPTGGKATTITSAAKDKAALQIVRNAPLGSQTVNAGCVNQNGVALQGGWSPDALNTATLHKNFQVNALVLNSGTVSKPAATLELIQQRDLNQGNRWGAWFRNDLEVFAGPSFNWNGTMHTEGSLFFGNGTLHAFLISSPSSCLFGSDGGILASDITMTKIPDPKSSNTLQFQGQLVGGKINANSLDSPAATIDETSKDSFTLNSKNDSVLSNKPSEISLDPLQLLTADTSVARNSDSPTPDTNSNTSKRDSNWDGNSNSLVQGISPVKGRVSNRAETKPYVDDTYRADNRYGPKLPPNGIPTGFKVGDPIPTTDPDYSKLTTNTVPASTPEAVGLDGYWERRADNEGLRVIVGQRLELGPPLVLASVAGTTNEALQRRNLRDDISAVQATAIYHHGSKLTNPDVDYPVACLATTVHPGTATTLQRSATFQNIIFQNAAGNPITLKSDFFDGWGTNGWEYNVPDPASFPNSSMRKALGNLANYAGDPYGYYPAKQDSASKIYVGSTAVTHPYPQLTQAGDFSNLRLAYNNLVTSGYVFSSLSLADQATLQTAACTLGMLAYEVKSLTDFSYASNISLLTALNNKIPASGNPAQVIAAVTKSDSKLGQLARLIYIKEQLKWDRLVPQAPNPGCDLTNYTTNPALTTLTNLSKLCPQNQYFNSLYYLFPNTGAVSTPQPESPDRLSDSYIASVNSPTTTPTPAITAPNPYRPLSNFDLDQIKLAPRDIGSWVLGNEVVSSPSATTKVPNYSQQELIQYIDNSGASTIYRVPLKDTALFNGREMMNIRVLNFDLDLLRRTKSSATGTDTWLPAGGIVFAFREDAVREDAIARPAKVTWSNYTNQWTSNYDFGPPTAYRMNADPTNLQDPPLSDPTGILPKPSYPTGVSPKPTDYYADPERRPYGFRLKNGSNLQRSIISATNISGLSFISDQPVYIQADSKNGFNLHDNSGTRLEEFSEYLKDDWSNFYSRTTLDPNFARSKDSWLPSVILADAISILSNNFCDGSIEDGFLTAGIDTSNSTPFVDRQQYGCTTSGGSTGYTSYLNQNRPKNALTGGVTWQRETNLDDPTTSPIAISPNGVPMTSSGPYSGSYYAFTDHKVDDNGGSQANQLNQPNESRINAIIVSGTVPSRVGESYGGFHNFPRFLEDWHNINLHISGSFIQLNFSNYATGPFDQDNWEASSTACNDNNSCQAALVGSDKEIIRYYSPPNSLWGYDVGLQYQPPGPVSRRFASIPNTRSEFYKELPVDDPYIKLLRCATLVTTGTKFDSSASCP